jgi:hypothetical protein
MTNYQEVVRLLPTLNKKELAQVLSAVKALGALPQNVRAGPTPQLDDARQVLKCMCEHLAHRGVEFPQVAVLTRMGVYLSFKSKVPALMQYLTNAGITTKQYQWAVLSMGFGYLYDNLIARGWSVDATTLMTRIHLIPAMINREFPGYAEAGYLKFALAQHTMTTQTTK